MGGSYTLSGNNQIAFSQMMSTKMACGDMMLESDFHKVLEITTSYQSNENELRLLDANGNVIALFEIAAGQ